MDKVLPSTTDDDQPLVEAGYHYEDRFFDDVEGIVAVFDFDYEKIIAFDWDVAVASWVTAPCFFPLLALFCEEPRPDCTAGVPCVTYANIQWQTKAMHVAVHRDGIRFVTDRRKSGWGFSCQDVGKNSKTVPFDKLTDCDVQEPAGTAVCCFVPNVLTTVSVDTASTGGPAGHELALRGLKDPHGLKKCVWDCKRGHVNFGGDGAILGVGSHAMHRGASDRGGETASLLMLTEIRDELRLHTALLQSNAEKA